MKRLILVLALVVASGCVKAPPSLSPVGAAAFYKTRVVKALDVVRDTAIDAAATVPPLVSQSTANAVVRVHKSALLTIQASASGWQAAVGTGLDEGLKNLPAADGKVVAPYVALVHVLLNEVK